VRSWRRSAAWRRTTSDDRRARPTLRCLREDLRQAVPPVNTPLDEVPHPLLAKASERFANDGTHQERIASDPVSVAPSALLNLGERPAIRARAPAIHHDHGITQLRCLVNADHTPSVGLHASCALLRDVGAFRRGEVLGDLCYAACIAGTFASKALIETWSPPPAPVVAAYRTLPKPSRRERTRDCLFWA